MASVLGGGAGIGGALGAGVGGCVSVGGGVGNGPGAGVPGIGFVCVGAGAGATNSSKHQQPKSRNAAAIANSMMKSGFRP